MMNMMKTMALAFGAAAALDDTTSGTRCAHTMCLEWDCAEWCTCYDDTKDGVYADAGCAEVGEDTCACSEKKEAAAMGWMRVTPSMITSTSNEGTVTSVSADASGGAKISVDANQRGCGQGLGSAATHFIMGPWTKIKYTEDFDGHASCWSIFGATGYLAGLPKPNVHKLSEVDGDVLTNLNDMNDVKSASKTQRCDNEEDNFWHGKSSGAGDARGTVTLRRNDLNQPAGMSTGTSCTNTNTNFWHYTDIFVWM